MEFTINYVGVSIASVVTIVLGFLWYGPLFGKQWIALMGFTGEQTDKAKEKGVAASYMGMVITTVLMTYVLAMFLQLGNAITVANGLVVAFLLWLGFVMTTQASGIFWEGKPWSLFFLNTAYSLLAILLAAWILIWWQ